MNASYADLMDIPEEALNKISNAHAEIELAIRGWEDICANDFIKMQEVEDPHYCWVLCTSDDEAPGLCFNCGWQFENCLCRVEN